MNRKTTEAPVPEQIPAGRAPQRERKGFCSFAVGIFVFSAICAALPPLLQAATGAIYKASCAAAAKDSPDWGPSIEKKEGG